MQLYHGPVGVLPMMPEARAGVWQSGDILSVASDAERRRRRLEMYRQRHEANTRSYDVWTNAMANDQRQQTAQLFQRWLDSRCKRTTLSRSKSTKGEADAADSSTKSTITKSKRRHADEATMCGDVHLKSCDDASGSRGNNSPSTVSKQRKTTENTDSLSTNPQALDTSSAAPVSVSVASVVDSCKQSGMEPEVVTSDIDIGAFDDDPSAFLDIWKTINGSEFTSEFQKFLSESERDDSNLHLSAGELACLSASDVTDAVTVHSNSGENVPSLQTAALLPFQPLHNETKCVEVLPSSQTLPADNYSMPLWHQNVQVHEPVMNNLQLLPVPLPSYWPESSPELMKRHQVMQTKQHAGPRMMLHDVHSLSGMQRVHHQPQRHLVQSWNLMPMSTQHPQQYEMMPSDQPTWPQQQPQWQMPAHCVQQAQPQPFQCQPVHMCRHPVKKEIPLSVIGSSAADAITGSLQQMLSSGHRLLPHASAAAYTNVQVPAPNQSMYAGIEPSNQTEHPLPGFPVNQKGLCVNFREVVIPDFCSPANFMSHAATGQQFGPGPAGEVNQTRMIARGLDSLSVVPDDIFVSSADHFMSN